MASIGAAPAGRWAAPEEASAFHLSLVRLVVAMLLLAAGVALLVGQQEVRVVEAAVARVPLGWLVGEAVHVPGTDLVFYPDYAGPGLRALKVTFSCSAVPLLAPLAVLGSALALTRRLSATRVVVGVAIAGLVVFLVNLVRILLIAVTTANFGVDGYELSHRVVGSAVTVVGACLAFALTFRVVSSTARRRSGG